MKIQNFVSRNIQCKNRYFNCNAWMNWFEIHHILKFTVCVCVCVCVRHFTGGNMCEAIISKQIIPSMCHSELETLNIGHTGQEIKLKAVLTIFGVLTYTAGIRLDEWTFFRLFNQKLYFFKFLYVVYGSDFPGTFSQPSAHIISIVFTFWWVLWVLWRTHTHTHIYLSYESNRKDVWK